MLVIRSGISMKEVRKKGLWLNYSGTKQPLQCWGWSARTGFSTHQQCCSVCKGKHSWVGSMVTPPSQESVSHPHSPKSPLGSPTLAAFMVQGKI